MATFIEELAGKLHLDSDTDQAWGYVEEYWFQVTPNGKDGTLLINTAVHYADETARSNVSDGLSALVQNMPNTNFSVHGNSISVARKLPFGGLKVLEVEEMLQIMIYMFRKTGVKPACINCGAEGLHDFVKVNGGAMMLCKDCQQQVNAQITQGEADHTQTKNNYLLGAVGALAGALVGSIAWIVIGLLGYLASLGGLVISFCAARGYMLMKGKINVAAIIIICVICLFALVFAQFTTMVISVNNEAATAGLGWSLMDSAQYSYEMLMIEPDAANDFLKNCLFGLVFLALGAFTVIRQLFVSAKAPAGTFQKL